MSPRLAGITLASAAVLSALSTAPVAADCTCRAGGQDYEVGQTVCLQTPTGLRFATCGMVLNNTSWHFSAPCVAAEVGTERAGPERSPRTESPAHAAGG